MTNMIAEPRDSLYKRPSKTLLSIKEANKASVLDRQSRSRENVILRKRLKVSSQLEADELKQKWSEEEDKEKVIEAIRHLKKGDKLKALTDLHKLFASHQSNAEEFLKHQGLQPLHSCFKSLNVDVLHTSAWCVINLIAVSTEPACNNVLMCLAPTLSQFLKGSDVVMQELCAWGLANLAGESMSNVDTLHSQGCTDTLLELLDTPYHLANQERNCSILFGLINMARSSFSCAQYMLEKGLIRILQLLWKDVLADSPLNFELGWLVNCVYSRSDTVSLHSTDYPAVTRLVCDRLNDVMKGPNSQHRERICFSLVRCLSNLVGLKPMMSRVFLNDPLTFDTINDLLSSEQDNLKQEVLVLINNCMADVCSRVLLTYQPLILSKILTQCQSNSVHLLTQILGIVEAMAKTSSQVDAYLIQQGVLSILLQTLNNASQEEEKCSFVTTGEEVALYKTIISIMTDLVSSQPELARTVINSEEPQQVIKHKSSLAKVTTLESVNTDLAHKAGHLVELLGLELT